MCCVPNGHKYELKLILQIHVTTRGLFAPTEKQFHELFIVLISTLEVKGKHGWHLEGASLPIPLSSIYGLTIAPSLTNSNLS